MAEEGQDAEQQGVFHAASGLEQTLHPEHQKAVGGDVGVAVEEPTLRAHTHGPQAQQHLLEQFAGVDRVFFAVITVVSLLDHPVQVG